MIILCGPVTDAAHFALFAQYCPEWAVHVELMRKNSKFLDLRPTTPKHEMFYHFKSHLSM